MTENEPTSDRCRDNYFHDKWQIDSRDFV